MEYIHKVHYYETDKMGITHHSNYIRWMEEARMAFLETMGFHMKGFEDQQVVCPVVSVQCQYLQTTTFDDEILIAVTLEAYTGVRFTMGYQMYNRANGQLVLSGSSTHCFVDTAGRPVILRRRFPQFHRTMEQILANGSGQQAVFQEQNM
jgi:acyl-CoA thioester hydrolase